MFINFALRSVPVCACKRARHAIRGLLKDNRYRDDGAVRKAISYGSSLHMERYLGLPNRLPYAAISLELAATAATGFVMGWKRRPARAFGAADARKSCLTALGMVVPLMSVTIVAI